MSEQSSMEKDAGSGIEPAVRAPVGEWWTLQQAVAWIVTEDDALVAELPARARHFESLGQDSGMQTWAELAAQIAKRGLAAGGSPFFGAVDQARETLRQACERSSVNASGVEVSSGRRLPIPPLDFVGAELWHADGTSLHQVSGVHGSTAQWRGLRFLADEVRSAIQGERRSCEDRGHSDTDNLEPKKRGRRKGPGYNRQDIPKFKRMKVLIEKGVPVTTAAKQIEREDDPKAEKSPIWEGLRKTYDRWVASVDGN
jgi:hypothetical protein